MIQIIQADVMDGLAQIPDQSVQCVVTSPPYWGLRDYGVEGQIGLEKTPEEYVAKMVEVFREVRRVLRDDGTVWLNLGDSYATNGHEESRDRKGDHLMGGGLRSWGEDRQWNMKTCGCGGLKQKDLVGQPWRVAFALQADGWYLRSDIIWSKPNPMPESVTDRPTKAHEYVFLLTKRARYFYDADAVRDTAQNRPFDPAEKCKRRHGTGWHDNAYAPGATGYGNNPAGRNRRTVWEIATQPFPAAHFATFPEALVEPCIKAGTSERGCCSVCGAPWVRVVEASPEYKKLLGSRIMDDSYVGGTLARGKTFTSKTPKVTSEYNTIGWQPACTCTADTIPCTVLDPFGGSGTVGKVARDLNRKAILIEINPEYVKIARERLRLNEQLGVFA